MTLDSSPALPRHSNCDVGLVICKFQTQFPYVKVGGDDIPISGQLLGLLGCSVNQAERSSVAAWVLMCPGLFAPSFCGVVHWVFPLELESSVTLPAGVALAPFPEPSNCLGFRSKTVFQKSQEQKTKSEVKKKRGKKGKEKERKREYDKKKTKGSGE